MFRKYNERDLTASTDRITDERARSDISSDSSFIIGKQHSVTKTDNNRELYVRYFVRELILPFLASIRYAYVSQERNNIINFETGLFFVLFFFFLRIYRAIIRIFITRSIRRRNEVGFDEEGGRGRRGSGQVSCRSFANRDNANER